MLERVRFSNDPFMAALAKAIGDTDEPTQEQDGIVLDVGFNFHNLVDRREWDSPYMFDEREDEVPSYGVCDSVAQFLEKYGEKLKASKHKYAVGFTRVVRADQPESGGWRWHKWGEYIGTHQQQHEYLHDEEGIDEVWCFSVMRKKDR